jgi:hypothetical protein
VGWQSSKRGLSQIWLQVKGQGKTSYMLATVVFVFWRMFATWRKFSQKMFVHGGVGGVEMIFLVILGICFAITRN